MRIISRLLRQLWLLALLPFPAFAQHQEAALAARGRVERVHLCQLDADMTRMDLDLSLVVQNTGRERIVLPDIGSSRFQKDPAPRNHYNFGK